MGKRDFAVDPGYKLLKDQIKNDRKNTVAIVGSGLSRDKFGSWADLINNLCSECRVMIDRSRAGGLSELADECKNKNLSVYEQYLRSHFGRDDGHVKKEYVQLAKLELDRYITLNFEGSLEEALKIESRSSLVSHTYPNLYFLENPLSKLIYVHGRVPADDKEKLEIVLTKTEFDHAYKKDGSCNSYNLMSNIFVQKHCFFVGCGLDEEPLQNMLRESIRVIVPRARSTTAVSRHFALRPNPGIDKIEKEINEFKQYGIHVIWYDSRDNHRELYYILEDLLFDPFPWSIGDSRSK